MDLISLLMWRLALDTCNCAALFSMAASEVANHLAWLVDSLLCRLRVGVWAKSGKKWTSDSTSTDASSTVVSGMGCTSSFGCLLLLERVRYEQCHSLFGVSVHEHSCAPRAVFSLAPTEKQSE